MYTDFFISHSKETKLLLAIPLVQSLSSLGFNVWIDRNGIVAGQHIYHKIEEGVDVSCIQQILGHSSIKTTQIYIHVAARKQAEILQRYHPRNAMKIKVA